METAGFCECLAGRAFLRDTRETVCFAILSFLLYYILTHTIYIIITHRCWGVLLRENPSHNPWELEIVIPTFLYKIHYGFSSTPTSPFPYPWRLPVQTLTTPILSVKWGFGAVGKHWNKPSFGRCNRAYCGIRRGRQDTIPRSLVGVGA